MGIVNPKSAITTSNEALPSELSLTDEEREILVRVVGILRRVRYGAVALVIHDGKVMQVETEEKFRLQ